MQSACLLQLYVTRNVQTHHHFPKRFDHHVIPTLFMISYSFFTSSTRVLPVVLSIIDEYTWGMIVCTPASKAIATTSAKFCTVMPPVGSRGKCSRAQIRAISSYCFLVCNPLSGNSLTELPPMSLISDIALARWISASACCDERGPVLIFT